jgi:hypothetical protein
MLECWNAGMLECWNAGMLEDEGGLEFSKVRSTPYLVVDWVPRGRGSWMWRILYACSRRVRSIQCKVPYLTEYLRYLGTYLTC